MLRRYEFARFALQHSPEKEQRLLAYQAKDEASVPKNEDDVNTPSELPKAISAIQNETRERLAFLNDLADIKMRKEEGNDMSNAVLHRFFNTHQEFLDQYFRDDPESTLDEVKKSSNTLNILLRVFDTELHEIIGRSLEKLGPRYSFHLTEKSFEQGFMRAKMNIPDNRKFTEDEVKQFKEQNYVPSSYLYKGTIQLNMAHTDFDFEKKLEQLRKTRPNITEEQVLEIVERSRDRAIVHEVAHYTLDRKDREETRIKQFAAHLKTALKLEKLEGYELWDNLARAVEDRFNGHFRGQPVTEYLHEALAIVAAGKRFPHEKDVKERAVMKAFEALYAKAAEDPRIKEIYKKFDTDVTDVAYGSENNEGALAYARRKMAVASTEREENMIFKKKFDEHDCGLLHTLHPEEMEEGKQAAAEEIRKTAISMQTYEDIRQKIEEAKKAYNEVEEGSKAYLASIPPDASKEEKIMLDTMLGKFSEDILGISAVEKEIMTFQNWEKADPLVYEEKNALARKYDFGHHGEYAPTQSRGSIIVLDEQNSGDRKKVLEELKDVIANYFEPLTKIAEAFGKQESEREEEKDSGGSPKGVMDWMKKTFGKQGGVHWLSVYDMIKVYNIYKDAIREKYHAGQKIRTYDAAKEWNLWSALQPDLDKQAKSANDEETTKFKEYLVKDGFNYEDLFRSGGVLDQNRGNINRAKAVIDYAADHAWLYKMNRFNGRDVYGLDYEGIWGKRSFEELVEHNAEQQDKESGAGYSKVNNLPELFMIIDDIEKQLKLKNIWKVHGMMKRLQEKGKLAEGNTWAVATIMRAMMRDPLLMEIMDNGMLDKIGTLGIESSAWALTLMKTQRKSILGLQKATKEANGDEKLHMELAQKYAASDPKFVIARTMKIIEDMLPDVLKHKRNEKGEPDFRDLNREIAKVLSGQEVRGVKNGEPFMISIFDGNITEFVAYRKHYNTYTSATPTEPGKTDPDFFNPENNGSDMILLNASEMAAILSRTSQGYWTHESAARNFMTMIMMRDHKLKDEPAIQKNYREIMKRKLSYWLQKVIPQANARAGLLLDKLRDDEVMNKYLPEESIGGNIIFEMFNREMISDEDYINMNVKEATKSKKSTNAHEKNLKIIQDRKDAAGNG